MPAAFAAARYVTRRPAGRGAVREVCEHLLAARVRS
jgi:3-deoxy-D-manno-octulosonate 8-phosphate phosphatase (KDO 8-P phosphatase)